MNDTSHKWHFICRRSLGHFVVLSVDAPNKELAIEAGSRAVATSFGITIEELSQHFYSDAHMVLGCSGTCK